MNSYSFFEIFVDISVALSWNDVKFTHCVRENVLDIEISTEYKLLIFTLRCCQTKVVERTVYVYSPMPEIKAEYLFQCYACLYLRLVVYFDFWRIRLMLDSTKNFLTLLRLIFIIS